MQRVWENKTRALNCICPKCNKPLSLKDLEIGFSMYCSKCYQREFGTGDTEVPSTQSKVSLKGLKK
jgi:hypothetical protein